MHLLGAILLCLLAAHGTRSENRFRRPPGPGPAGDFRDNPSYPLGSQLDLQWETDFESIDLLIWQEADYTSEPTYSRIISNTRSLGMLWTVSYNGFPSHHDPTKSPVYFIQMFKSGDSVGNITCHYFNITEPSASSTSSASAAASTTLSFPSGFTPSVTLSSSPLAQAADGGTPTGTVAGIAVGVALGTLAIIGLVGWVFWRRLQKKKLGPTAHEVHEVRPSGEKVYYSGLATSQGCYEADATMEVRYEMPSGTHHGEDRTTSSSRA